MRRGLSIFLILFFGAGPLLAALPASDAARLPSCCRRQGAHHCAMSVRLLARMAQAATGADPILGAPTHCPNYPGYIPASLTTGHALLPSPVSLPVPALQDHAPTAGRNAARVGQIRTRTARGPPTAGLS